MDNTNISFHPVQRIGKSSDVRMRPIIARFVSKRQGVKVSL